MRACPYCGSQRTRKWYTYEGDSVNRCSKCDLIFRGCSGDEGAWEEYYRKHYFQDFAEEQEGSLRASIYEEVLEIIGRNTTEGALFDIGAGSGTLLAMAKERGWSVAGQEISVDSCRAAREKYGLELLQKDLKTLRLPSDAYDAVTMVNIFDHLIEPWFLLEDIHRALKTGGILYIRVPNGSLHSLGYRLSSIFPPGSLREKVQKFFVLHRYHISPRFIRALLGRNGFRPVVVGPSTVSKDVPYSTFTKSERRLVVGLKSLFPVFSRALSRLSTGEIILSPSIHVYGRKHQTRATTGVKSCRMG